MKKLTISNFGLDPKDLTAQKRLEPALALAIFEGRLAGTERLDVYIYRIAPKPPFAPKGTPSYLSRMETPKTIDEIKAEIGGGVFRFVGNSFAEKDVETNQRKTVVDFIFEIDALPLAERILAATHPNRNEVIAAPPVGARPGAPGPAPGGRVDEELAFLQKAKLYKEVFGNGHNNGGAMEMLNVFLKGVEFQKAMHKDDKTTGSTGWDIAKEVISLVRQEAARLPRRAAVAPAPAAAHSPAGAVVVEPPAVAVAGKMPAEPPAIDSLDALLEFVMDSFDEGKTAGETAKDIVDGVPKWELAKILSFPDDNVVAIVKNGSKQFEGDWLAERPEEKDAWLKELIQETRRLNVPSH